MTPRIMGIVNITPDSFSDAGDFYNPAQAMKHCDDLIEAGAEILDIGAESTRPGATPVNSSEEWRRLEQVLKVIAKKYNVSVDTRHDETMLRAADLGVSMINNVEGLAKTTTLMKLSQFKNLNYVCMHMHGNPETMKANPLSSAKTISTIDTFFSAAQNTLLEAGFLPNRLWLDPGIGFGKTLVGNFLILKNISNWSKKFQVLAGLSRKSFIGNSFGIETPKDRDMVSKVFEIKAMIDGASIIRTHDVNTLAKLRNKIFTNDYFSGLSSAVTPIDA